MSTATASTETVAPITLTTNAAQQIKTVQANEPEKAGKALRLFVEPGGCSGMQYGMDFDERRDGDLTGEFDGVEVVVDAISANYLKGVVVDYVDALTGGGFKISNPQAKQSCGCGKSFEA